MEVKLSYPPLPGAAGFAWYVDGAANGAPLVEEGWGALPGIGAGGGGLEGIFTWPGMGAPGGAIIGGIVGVGRYPTMTKKRNSDI